LSPVDIFDTHTFDVEGQHEIFKARTEFSDFEYVKTLGLKIIAGRDFSGELCNRYHKCGSYQSHAAKELGFTPGKAIGKWIKNPVRDSFKKKDRRRREDFNFPFLKENMDGWLFRPGFLIHFPIALRV